MNIVNLEKPEGVIATLGGQTAVNLAASLAKRGVKIIGTDCDAIERAENRDAFDAVIKIPRHSEPEGRGGHGYRNQVAAVAAVSATPFSCARASCSAAGLWR